MFPFASETSNRNDHSSTTPGVSDFMKFASTLLSGGNETGSIFNSPEFTQSMESMTRALLNTLNNNNGNAANNSNNNNDHIIENNVISKKKEILVERKI